MATDQPARPRQGRSITAAAKRLTIRDQSPRGGTGVKRADDGWQGEAWAYFDTIPEVKFAARFLGAALSRLRLFPAIIVEQDQPPVPLADAATIEGTGVTAALAQAADEEMDRLDGGSGLAGILRSYGVQLTIGGEGTLVGRDVDGEEVWQVFSDRAMTRKDGALAVKETPGSAAEVLPDDAFAARIWRAHEAWPGLPDSNMRAVLDVCEELLIYARQFRAVGRSRNNAGLLLLPNELDFANERVVIDPDDDEEPEADPPPAVDVDESDEDELTPLERGIVESMVTPTADDGSASQVVPHIIRGPKDALEQVRHVPLDRKIDEHAVERIVHLISRLANGLDVPVEVLTGVADANHWTAWQIEDSTYKAHVEPLAQIPADGIALVHLRPALLARGDDFDPTVVKRIVLAIDPSDLVVRPNRVADAKDAYDRDAIGWEALRTYLGFTDADAPDMEELLVKYTLGRSVGGLSLTRDLLNLIGYKDVPDAEEAAETTGEGLPELPPGQPADDSGDNGGDAEPESTPGETSRLLAALIAASQSRSELGERLAAIDVRLRDRLQAAASATLTAALARAGARLRAAAQGDPALASEVKGHPNEEVGAILGDRGAALAPAEELLGPGDFVSLAARWTSEVTAARESAVQAAQREALGHGMTPDSFASLASEELGHADEDASEGWALLLGALLTLGRSRIFTPDGSPDDGEFDPHVSVPAGLVRDALARAGGALGEQTAAPSATGAGTASGGPASGVRMLRLVQRTGARQVAWRWDVGMPAVPFPPHQALDGLVFQSWDDEQLASAGFPNRGHYYPGDHRGCQCDAVPVLIWAEESPSSVPADVA